MQKTKRQNTEKYGGNLVTKINQQEKEKMTMKKQMWTCGYIYDPGSRGSRRRYCPGTAFEDIPETGYVHSVDWEKMFLFLVED